MYLNPLVIDEKFVGYDELLKLDARRAVDYMERLVRECSANVETSKEAFRYMVLYATYSFSSLNLREVEELFHKYQWVLDDIETRNLIIERILARKLYERNVSQFAQQAVQTNYAMSIGLKPHSGSDLTVFGISVPSLMDRQLRLFANILQLGVSSIEFRGVDAKSIEGMPSTIKYDATLGAAANFLSHLKVWEEIVSRNIEFAVVVEDDVVLGGLPLISRWLTEISELDIVFLNNRVVPNYATVPDLENTGEESVESVLLPVFYGCGVDGYLVTLQGAKKLIALFDVLVAPIDLQLMAHMEQANPEAGDWTKCRETRQSEVRLKCRRWYPFLVDHPPANYSAVMNQYLRGYCPALWAGENR